MKQISLYFVSTHTDPILSYPTYLLFCAGYEQRVHQLLELEDHS